MSCRSKVLQYDKKILNSFMYAINSVWRERKTLKQQILIILFSKSERLHRAFQQESQEISWLLQDFLNYEFKDWEI